MFGKKKPKKKWHRIVGIAFSLVSLIILTYVSISLIAGRQVNFNWFTSIFVPTAPIEIADELPFYVGRNRTFANLGDGIAAAGTLGIQVLDHNGNETLRDAFRMFRPAVSANNGRAIAFDIGGTAARVFDSGQLISSIEASGPIVSASVNQRGWVAVSTQEDNALRGVITVYNDRGIGMYRVNLGSGYALSAALSNDNRTLAVLNLIDTGSRVALFHGLRGQEPDSEFILPGSLVLDIRFLSNNNLLAISTDSLIIIDDDGNGSALFEFFEKRLSGFIIQDGVIILNLMDYGVGHVGRVVKLDERGRIQGELTTNREIISMSYKNGSLFVLRNDGITIYDSEFNELHFYGENPLSGLTRVLALDAGVAVATGEHLALAVRVNDD
ncbi:MAG: DUF5711 family protein [Oscillospiraceae bacterium]|nr:DUF5711 family protein [Oscillospiraceae bacterium]